MRRKDIVYDRNGSIMLMDITKQYYRDNSQEFFDSTVIADVSPLHERFLRYVPDGARILDLGCGSGRDTKVFLDRGYSVEAVDGSRELCVLASKYTGIEVKCIDFTTIDCKDCYDAIWACASLLHIPSVQLPELFVRLRDALRQNGIFYMSFKYGDYEGERDDRFFNDMTSEKFRTVINGVSGLDFVEEWESEDVRRGKIVHWYNVILRKG